MASRSGLQRASIPSSSGGSTSAQAHILFHQSWNSTSVILCWDICHSFIGKPSTQGGVVFELAGEHEFFVIDMKGYFSIWFGFWVLSCVGPCRDCGQYPSRMDDLGK